MKPEEEMEETRKKEYCKRGRKERDEGGIPFIELIV